MDLFQMLTGGLKDKHEYEDFANRMIKGIRRKDIPIRKYWTAMVQ